MVRSTQKTAVLALASFGLVAAYPVRRLVPQEHSHEDVLRVVNTFLKQNNPDNIVDGVFGLLGNAAASTGQGSFPDTDCLQAGISDRAFTNAKAAGSVDGMTNALIFRTLERNTGRVGQPSVDCTAVTPVNPEVAALSQHQDSASPNAATINKAIVLELARQIASVGGDPLDALKSGTFAPGNVNDPTARGNSCNDANDANGCINTLNLLVPDATPEEIAAAVAGGGNDNDNGNAGNDANGGDDQEAPAPPAATGIAAKNPNTGVCEVDGGAAAPPPPPVDEDNDEEVDEPEDDDDDNVVCPPQATVTVTVTAAPQATQPPKTTAAPPKPTAAPQNTATATATAGAPVETANFDFGSCEDPSIFFGPGLDGRKQTEFSFIPNNREDFTQGSALNPQIVMRAICDTFVNKCGFNNGDQIVVNCRRAQQEAVQFGNDPQAADFFNAALGFQSNFASIDTNAPTGSQLTADTGANGQLTFRNCEDPSIKFGPGFEGRAANEFTFINNNQADFPHGSAKNFDIIAQFTCDNLVNRCGFTNDDATVKICRKAQQDAKALGLTGATADFFNKALGINTNFAALDA